MVIRQGYAPLGSITLDEIDRAILRLLREDGRRSNADIARLVGVSQPTVRQRLDRILSCGAARVTIRMNPAALGRSVDVIIRLRVAGRSIQHVANDVARMEEVHYVSEILGSWQIELEAYVRDNDEVCRLVEAVSSMPGVAAVETALVTRTEKYNYEAEGELLDADIAQAKAAQSEPGGQ
jgi:Lrp/AsnC family transcriptional regulator for asnA, asnC and gidA